MNGKYTIEVSNKKVTYRLEIKRNITIIQGDSGTGKTTLFRMINEYNRYGIIFQTQKKRSYLLMKIVNIFIQGIFLNLLITLIIILYL